MLTNEKILYRGKIYSLYDWETNPWMFKDWFVHHKIPPHEWTIKKYLELGKGWRTILVHNQGLSAETLLVFTEEITVVTPKNWRITFYQ